MFIWERPQVGDDRPLAERMAGFVVYELGEPNDALQLRKPLDRSKPKADHKIAAHIGTSVIMATSRCLKEAKYAGPIPSVRDPRKSSNLATSSGRRKRDLKHPRGQSIAFRREDAP